MPTNRTIEEIIQLAQAPNLTKPGGPPCPPWCTTGPHDWTRPALEDAPWHRIHSHQVAQVDDVTVAVEQYEELADHADGGGWIPSQIAVSVVGKAEDMSAAAAREVGQAVVTASVIARDGSAPECAKPTVAGRTCIESLADGWINAPDLCGPCTRVFMAAVDGIAGPLVWHPNYIERGAL